MSRPSSWFPAWRSARLAWLLAGLGAAAAWAQPPAVIGGPFALVDQNDRPVTDRDLRGSYLLIYFGETSCTDLCPTSVAKMARVLHLLASPESPEPPEWRGGARAKLRAVFITVDPQRDTPAAMGSYTGQYSPKILALTGTPSAIARVTAEYHVIIRERETKRGDVEHSERFYLIGPDGRLLKEFSGNMTAESMADAIGALSRTG
jgi:protein SCO1/2